MEQKVPNSTDVAKSRKSLNLNQEQNQIFGSPMKDYKLNFSSFSQVSDIRKFNKAGSGNNSGSGNSRSGDNSNEHIRDLLGEIA